MTALGASSREASIAGFGAVAGYSTINTKGIQASVDRRAASGGGTVVVLQGVSSTAHYSSSLTPLARTSCA